MNDERYDYREAVKSDIRDWLKENRATATRAELEDECAWLVDVLWDCDSVTGNGSGSYYCSTWKAESALCHNWDLLAEAKALWDSEELVDNPEAADVLVRCHLLYECLHAVVEEWPNVGEGE